MAPRPSPIAPALRAARRARVFAAMEAHDLDVLVLGRVANIRYVSGVPILWNAGTRPFGPGCVVVRDDAGALPAEHLGRGRARRDPPRPPVRDHVEPDELRRRCCRASTARRRTPRRRSAPTRMSPLFAQLLPMAFPDAEIVDGGPALRPARRIKTAEEVDAHPRRDRGRRRGAGRGASAELRPGVTERELTGVFMDAMASQGVTTPATQDVVRVTSPGARRGDRRRARRAPATSSSFDAGVVAGGYVGEVGRTWPVGPDGATPAACRRRLYRRWDELWHRLLDACRPVRPASGLLEAYRRGRRTAAPDADRPRPRPRLRRPGRHPRPARAPPPRERLDPGVVLVVTAAVIDDTASDRSSTARARAHHPRRTGGAVTQPVLEPRTSRSPPMTDDRCRRPRRPRPTTSSTRRTERRRSPRSRSTGPTSSTRRRSAMRLRYADLLHQANIDDDVKVLVDPRRRRRLRHRRRPRPSSWRPCGTEDGLLREFGLEDDDVTYPPRRNFRHGATATQWFTNPRGGCRSLQEFKKISIVEVKGYCYGWHFYQAGDADLVDLVRRRAVRPRRLPLRRRRAADVVVGADDGPAQVPGDGLHRPAVHRRGDVRVRLRQQRRAARRARGRGRRSTRWPAPRTARPTSSSCRSRSSRS